VHELPGGQQPDRVVLSNRAWQRHNLGSRRGVQYRARLSKLHRHRQRVGRLRIAHPDSVADAHLYTYSNGNSDGYNNLDTEADAYAALSALTAASSHSGAETVMGRS
jgi:hypothetical protein